VVSSPEIYSLYTRKKLFIHPLLWTELHLQVLRCTFADISIRNPDINRAILRQSDNVEMALGLIRTDILESNFYIRQKAIEGLIAQKNNRPFTTSR